MKILILIFLAITSEVALAGEWDWVYYLNEAHQSCSKGKPAQLRINYEVSEYGDQVATDTEDYKTPKVFQIGHEKGYAHNIKNSEGYGEWCPYGEGKPCRPGGKRVFSQKINAYFIDSGNLSMFNDTTLKFSYPLISVDYHYPDYRLEYGKSKATLFLVDENCNSKKICEVSVEMGRTESPTCEYKIKQSDIFDKKNNPALLSRQKLKKMLDRLNSEVETKTFKEIHELDQIIREVIDKPFDEISREDLLEYNVDWVIARYDRLFKDVNELSNDIANKKREINKTLEKIKIDIKNDFASQGIDIENKNDFVFDDFNIDLTIEYPEIFDVEEEITSSNNIYDEMAQETIDRLSLLYRQNDRKDFLKTVLSWINSSQETLKVLLNERGGIYDGEEKLYEESIKKVENYLYVSPGYLDRSLWFKDSPVPVDVRELLDKSIIRSDPQVGLAFKEELKSWGGKPLTEKQKNLLKTIRVLGYGFDYIYKSFGNTANEALERWKEIAAGVVKIAASAGCLAGAAAAGNGGDIYELSSGRDLCDPSKELTPAGYTIAAFSILVGNSKTLRGIAELFGVTTAVKRSINIADGLFDLAKKYGFKTKKQLEDFKQLLLISFFQNTKSNAIKIVTVENVLASARNLNLKNSQDFKLLSTELNAFKAGSTRGFDLSGRMTRQPNRNILYQESGSLTCGPTSCGMVLDTLGLPKKLSDLIFQAGSKATTGEELVTLLRKNKINARLSGETFIRDIEKLTQNGRPVIVMVEGSRPNIGHWIVVDGVTIRNGKKVIAIRDPAPSQGAYFELIDSFKSRYKKIAVIPNKGVLN